MNDGGPAFPAFNPLGPDGDEIGIEYDGMTLRDYFAAKAMQALVSNTTYFNNESERKFHGEGAAISAYRLADAMLAERAK